MSPGIYNIPDHYKGDTFKSKQFTIEVNASPFDLTGYTIKMHVRTDSCGVDKQSTGATFIDSFSYWHNLWVYHIIGAQANTYCAKVTDQYGRETCLCLIRQHDVIPRRYSIPLPEMLHVDVETLEKYRNVHEIEVTAVDTREVRGVISNYFQYSE